MTPGKSLGGERETFHWQGKKNTSLLFTRGEKYGYGVKETGRSDTGQGPSQ